MSLLLNFFASAILASLLMAVGLGVGIKFHGDREKSRPFECGFTPKSSARLPFSIRFFLVSLIFLIFDVELILIFPIVPALVSAPLFATFAGVLIVIFVLVVGLSHEVAQGRLAWAE
jgi:NADH-ubiquinone oxidoreductase chain 3